MANTENATEMKLKLLAAMVPHHFDNPDGCLGYRRLHAVQKTQIERARANPLQTAKPIGRHPPVLNLLPSRLCKYLGEILPPDIHHEGR